MFLPACESVATVFLWVRVSLGVCVRDLCFVFLVLCVGVSELVMYLLPLLVNVRAFYVAFAFKHRLVLCMYHILKQSLSSVDVSVELLCGFARGCGLFHWLLNLDVVLSGQAVIFLSCPTTGSLTKLIARDTSRRSMRISHLLYASRGRGCLIVR